jgi:hypothetical protein
MEALLRVVSEYFKTIYNVASGSVWLWNLDSDFMGGTQTEGVWEQGAEEDIWTEGGWGDGRVEKTT